MSFLATGQRLAEAQKVLNAVLGSEVGLPPSFAFMLDLISDGLETTSMHPNLLIFIHTCLENVLTKHLAFLDKGELKPQDSLAQVFL